MKITSRSTIIFLFLFVIGISTILFFVGRKNVNEVEAKDFPFTVQEKYFTSIEIEEGDTLWSISEEYMTPEYKSRNEFIEEVREMNHITGSMIQAGDKLLIPYYSHGERAF